MTRSSLLAGALLLALPALARAQAAANAPPPLDSAAPARAADDGPARRSTARDSAAHADTTTKSAPAAPQTALTALAGLTLSGYAEASYAASNHPNGGTITGRLYDRFQNQFTLDAIKLVLDKPYDASRWDAGFHTDLLFGQNASVLHSTGFALGDQGDITQLFVTLNVPTPNGNGLQLKAGKMVTLMGLEVIEDVNNPTWSEGNQFTYVENFTNVGLSAEYKWNRHLDTQLRVINGWDVVQDNNNGKSFMVRVGFYPDSASSIGIVGYYGPEETGTDRSKRSGVDLLLNRAFGKASLWLQGDYGHETAGPALPDSTRGASWWAGGAWLAYSFTPTVQLALRGDYVNDMQGARTSGVLGFPTNVAHRCESATATLNLRTWPHTLVRPEIRYDHSMLAAFGGRTNQVTFALSAAYLY